MSLAKYHKKRKFSDTPEPKGDVRKTRQKKLIFVVQEHHARALHYDFRLEMDGVLKSWAVPKGPSMNPHDHRLAVHVEDHPYSYRTFEGTIPEGNYGAGEVSIWDKGTYEPRKETNTPEKTLLKELKDGHITFVLHGEKLQGEFALIKTDMGGNETSWLLVKKGDSYASEEKIVEQATLEVAKKSALPQKVKPMLATLTKEPFDSVDWLYEIKWDGYRAIGAWDGQEAQLYSRNGLDFSKKYAAITEALAKSSHQLVVDGEIVTEDEDGRPHFEWLQNYHRRPQGRLAYQVFDLLWCNGRSTTELPLIERKKLLKNVLPKNSIIRYSDHVIGEGKSFFKAADAKHLEGIMAKRADSVYRPGVRSENWLKVKTHLRQEVVIGGFTEPRGSRQYIGALMLGVYQDGEFRYVGHSGGGIPTDQLAPLRKKLEGMERKKSPFVDIFKPNSIPHWVTPTLVCEVTFSEWTSDGRMRQPIFMGLRPDKEATDVHIEKAKTEVPGEKPMPRSRKVNFTHLDKVFWPEKGYTKGDVIAYYGQMSKVMLPYLKNRPQSMLRHPDGYKGFSFFQKDLEKPPTWAQTASIYSASNHKNVHYLVCDSKDSLLYMAQLGCIEINPWSSRLGSLENPDWAVIDLDPEGVSFDDVITVAQMVKKVCDELHIVSYPKTSGKTGIHIFIPMNAKYTYEQAEQFANILVHIVNERLPKLTSLERSPSKRPHRVYLDYLQNNEGQTLAAPYSIRPVKDASVSTPLHWDEVRKGLTPSQFTIGNMARRVEQVGDLWKPVLGKGIDIEKVIRAFRG